MVKTKLVNLGFKSSDKNHLVFTEFNIKELKVIRK